MTLLAHAAPIPWEGEPQTVLRWRTVGTTPEADGRVTFAASAPVLLRLRGRFGSGCVPEVSRRFTSGRQQVEVPVPVALASSSQMGSSPDRLVLVPVSVASGDRAVLSDTGSSDEGEREVSPVDRTTAGDSGLGRRPGVPAEPPPAHFVARLPTACGALQVYQAVADPLDQDDYAVVELGDELRAYQGLAPRDLVEPAVTGPHARAWQQNAALALGVGRLAGRDDAAVRALAQVWLNAALAEARAGAPAFASWDHLEPAGLPERELPNDLPSGYRLRGGASVSVPVAGKDALRLFMRAEGPSGGTTGVARWRLAIRFDDGPEDVATAVAGPEPEAPDVSRERSVSLVVPAGAKQVVLRALDASLLVRGLSARLKPTMGELLAGDRAGLTPERALAQLPGGAKAGLAGQLLTAERDGLSAVADAEPGASGDLWAALLLMRRAELQTDPARARRDADAALQAMRAVKESSDAAALGELVRARVVRRLARLDVLAGQPRAAAERLVALAARQALTMEDAALLADAETLAADDLLGRSSRALAVLDGLLARRPLDHALTVARNRHWALATAWRALASPVVLRPSGNDSPPEPADEARDVGFLEAPPGEPPSPPSGAAIEAGAFAALLPGGPGLRIVLPPAPPGRDPVVTLLWSRAGDAPYRPRLEVDGKPGVELTALTRFERFVLTLSAGAHELRIAGERGAGALFVSAPDLAGSLRWRRYAGVPQQGALGFALRETGMPQLARVALRLLAPAGTTVDGTVPVVVTADGPGGEPLTSVSLLWHTTGGAASDGLPAELAPGQMASAPATAVLPIPEGATRLRVELARGSRPRGEVLVAVAVRERRSGMPAFGASEALASETPSKGGEPAATPEAALSDVRRLTGELQAASRAQRPRLWLARAQALAALGKAAEAREDLLRASDDPHLQPGEWRRLRAAWTALDEQDGPAAHGPRGRVATSPALALLEANGKLPSDAQLARAETVLRSGEPAADPEALRRALAAAGVDAAAAELALLAAAREAGWAGDDYRAAAFWSALLALHPGLPAVRREAAAALVRVPDESARARAHLLAYGAATGDPEDPVARRLVRRAARLTRLEPLRFFDESGGVVRVRLQGSSDAGRMEAVASGDSDDGATGTAPLATELALLPPAPDADRASIVTADRAAVLTLKLNHPLAVTLRASTFETRKRQADSLGAAPISLAHSYDGLTPETLSCAAGTTCRSRPIRLPPGEHQMTVRLRGGVRPLGRVWFRAERARRPVFLTATTTGLSPPRGSRGRGRTPPAPAASPSLTLEHAVEYAVARPETPVRVTIEGPALLQVEVRGRVDAPPGSADVHAVRLDEETNAHTSEPSLTVAVPPARDSGAALETGGSASVPATAWLPLDERGPYLVEVRPQRGEALARIAVRTGLRGPRPLPPPATYAASSPPPRAAPPGLDAAAALQVRDGDVAPGWDAVGALTVTTGWRRRNTTPDGADVQVDEASLVGLAYRRQLADLPITFKLDGEARIRATDNSSQALGLQAFLDHPEHRWLRLLLAANGTIAPRGPDGATAYRADARALFAPSVALASGVYLINKVGVWTSARSLSDLDEQQAARIDPDLWSRYGAQHPRGLTLEEAVQAQPLLNLVATATARLTTNPSFSPADPDHVTVSAAVRALFGHFYAEANFRQAWFLADADRDGLSLRRAVGLRLFHTIWLSERQNLEIGIHASRQVDASATDLAAFLSWEGSNGRRFRDHTPLEDENYFFQQRGPGRERAALEAPAP